MTADLRKLLEAATRGPWHIDSEDPCAVISADHTVMADAPGCGPSTESDVELIVAAVNALPAMLTIVEAAKRFATLNLCAGQSTDDDVALDAAFDALTAALAQWEKR